MTGKLVPGEIMLTSGLGRGNAEMAGCRDGEMPGWRDAEMLKW
jgi:hypothetical protein